MPRRIGPAPFSAANRARFRVVVGERERAVEQPWHVDGLAHHLADRIGLTRAR